MTFEPIAEITVSTTSPEVVIEAAATGPTGLTGAGIASGGTAGQILAKKSATDYDTGWIDNYTEKLTTSVKASVAITKGQPVYVSGASGTNILVSISSNATEATSSKTLGLLDATVAVNGTASVVARGILAGLDTSSATVGDAVWLGVNGALLFGLANKPVAPAHQVYIGVVTRSHASLGEIYVNPQNGFELEELHNVLITSVANGDLLQYEASTSLWKNKALNTLTITPIQVTGTAVITSDARLSDARTPNGTAGGDLTGTYPNPTLSAVGSAGTYTKVTTDSKGRVTSGTSLAAGDIPNLPESQITNLVSDLAAKIATTTLKAYYSTPSTAIETFPRWAATTVTGASSGSQIFSFFTPLATLTVSSITMANNGASATPTHCRMAIYSVDASDNATLIAATADDTTIFATAGSTYTRSLVAGTVNGVTVPSSVTLTAGNRYAVSVLYQGTTPPTIYGANMGSTAGSSSLSPRLAGAISGLTEVAASRTSYPSSGGTAIWARMA